VYGPLLLFSQPLRAMEFSVAAQVFVSSDSPIHHRNHALLAFKALTRSQIVSGPDKAALRKLHFKCTAQVARVDLPASITQCFSHQLVITNNRVAFEQMLLCILKGFGWRRIEENYCYS
jgi:hypothetical protein